jgi:hypothetical protein
VGVAVPVYDVHGCPMPTRSVRVAQEGRRGVERSPVPLATQRALFPRRNDWSSGGCVVRGQRSRDRPVCPGCVAARDAQLQARTPSWLESHESGSIGRC